MLIKLFFNEIQTFTPPLMLFFPTVKRCNSSKDVRRCLSASYESTDNYSEQMRQLAPELVQPCDLCWPLCSSLLLMKHKAGGERKLACRPTNIPRTNQPTHPRHLLLSLEPKFHSWRWGGCWNCFMITRCKWRRKEEWRGHGWSRSHPKSLLFDWLTATVNVRLSRFFFTLSTEQR